MSEESKMLLEFLTDWLAWAESEEPDGRYSRSAGLCTNSGKWAAANGHDVDSFIYDVVREFPSQYFFGCADEYLERSIDRTQHKCPKRLKWVRAKIEELKE